MLAQQEGSRTRFGVAHRTGFGRAALAAAAPTVTATAKPTSPTPAPTATIKPSTATAAPPTTIPTAASSLLAVAEVVDGDTIKVNVSGKLESIRIIGLDTPEVVDPRNEVQCFGREASTKAKELLSGQQVRLVADPTQDNRDKYDRLLRYVDKADGTDFGLTMIASGYAHEYTYEVPYQRQAAYKAAQASAREKALGFWSSSTCNGDTTKPAGSVAAPSGSSPPVAASATATAFRVLATATIAGPAATATVLPVPTSTAVLSAPTAPAPIAVTGVDIVSLSSPVRPGGTATLKAQTSPNTQCSIAVIYKSGPSTAAGLGAKTAGADGSVSWSWLVGTRTTPGDWPVTVTCSGQSKTAMLSVR